MEKKFLLKTLINQQPNTELMQKENLYQIVGQSYECTKLMYPRDNFNVARDVTTAKKVSTPLTVYHINKVIMALKFLSFHS